MALVDGGTHKPESNWQVKKAGVASLKIFLSMKQVGPDGPAEGRLLASPYQLSRPRSRSLTCLYYFHSQKSYREKYLHNVRHSAPNKSSFQFLRRFFLKMAAVCVVT